MTSKRRSVAAAATAAALVLALAVCVGPRTTDAAARTKPTLSTRPPTQAANQPTISTASPSAPATRASPATAAATTAATTPAPTTAKLSSAAGQTTAKTTARTTPSTTPAPTVGPTPTKTAAAQTATTPRPSGTIAQPKPTVQPPSPFSSLPGGCNKATGSGRLSQQHVAVLLQLLDTLFRQVNGTNALGASYHPLIAGSVRLAFHACVGDSCGGCINLNNPSNNGLNVTISALTAFRAQLLQVPQFANCTLSHADLWQAAAIVALNNSVFNAQYTNVCSVPVVFGRTDCPTAPYTNEMLAYPDRRWTINPILAFAAKLGLTAQQFVALMGLHSLGVIRDFNGRVKAQWDHSADVANDATYFETLANQAKVWTAVPINYTSNSTPVMYSFSKDSPTNQLIFLTSDFSLSFNITEKDPTITGQPTAPLTSCPFSSTYSYVQQFATNITTWAQSLCGAWSVLTTRGYAPGALLVAAASSG